MKPNHANLAHPKTVAVIKWQEFDGIADAIFDELVKLGNQPVYFYYNQSIPERADVVFSFAPYGRFYPVIRQIATMPTSRRPFFFHWNMENPPDLRLPWVIMSSIGAFRSWVDRLNEQTGWKRQLINIPPLSLINNKLHKFRYVGDYYYANNQGLLDLYAESSNIYAQLHRDHGLPAISVPWGTHPSWYKDLNLERDIDVLWLGKRRTRRRSILLDKVRQQLLTHGIQMYVADNVEKPFIYRDERIQFLNRSKIVLNLLPTWYDHAFPYRFHVAAGNRCLIVSEKNLPHSQIYKPQYHYAESLPKKLTETIIYYLAHEEERKQITENAYRLVTEEMTFGSSIKKIMDAIENL